MEAEYAFTIKISSKMLDQMRMLADWQLVERGICQQSVNEACRIADDYKPRSQPCTQ